MNLFINLYRRRINSRFPVKQIYGKVVHKVPNRFRDLPPARTFISEKGRFANEQFDRKQPFQLRFAGPSVTGPNTLNQLSTLTPQKGSFQRLKELVWTERARELAQQRKTEEMAARAAVLKEISNGHG